LNSKSSFEKYKEIPRTDAVYTRAVPKAVITLALISPKGSTANPAHISIHPKKKDAIAVT
jgi:hypothetical protein